MSAGVPKVALVVAGSRGDATPFVALARALQDQDAYPVLMTHAEHRDLAQRYDVDFVELPGDPRTLLASRAGLDLLDTRDPIGALAGLRGIAGDLIDDVITALETALADVDVVVFSTLAVAAYHVGQVHGVPAVWGVLQPVTPSREYASLLVAPGRHLGPQLNLASHHIADFLAWSMLGSPLTAYRQRRGLPRLGRSQVRNSVLTLGAWSPLLFPAPQDWPANVVVTGAWTLPVETDAPLSPALTEFIDAGTAPVYVGLGSATVDDPAAVTAMMLAAARDVGVRVVMSVGWAGLGADLDHDAGPPSQAGPARVLVVDGEVPHQRLFPHCAAVVHHAGAGTTHTAAMAGVVSVPVPFWADQPFWAARTSALGISTPPVPKRRWTRALLAQAIAQGVGEPWRVARARALGANMQREDGAQVAAAHVLAVATAGARAEARARRPGRLTQRYRRLQ